jgi:hypothetical protein
MSAQPNLTIRLIRAFHGPRHERLRNIWEAIAEYISPKVNVRWFANTKRLQHAECYDVMWREEQEFDNQYVLFTEEDFLPDLTAGIGNWTGLGSFKFATQAAVGIMYCTRSPKSREISQQGAVPGGWFICINKDRFPEADEITFAGNPDPCNQVRARLADFKKIISLAPGEDGYPHHYGVEYPFGTHLFWSCHYHDDPKARVSGFKLGTIQKKVDWRVSQWIHEQPEDFKDILVARFGSDILGSCSEFIDLRDGFRRSFASSGASAAPKRKSL